MFGNVGALKNLKRKHPQILIALCGCMMEQEHVANKIYKSFPFVGLVFGTHSLHHFPELMYNALLDGKRVFERGNDDNQLYEGFPVKRDGTFKGWLPIMYGCNNFCTYCVVPYVRGRERSREKNIIVSEAKNMIESGYKDITLLGQNVNSYGKGLSEKVNFSQLLREVDSIDGDYWLRFMTSHPKDCSKELIDTIASGTHISKHLHLPFQCGSDRVLKAMNRHYDRRKYLEIINYAKEKIDGLSLTSDIIVGFPGETEEMFLETMDTCKKINFSKIHAFPYSERKGTKASMMDGKVPESVKHERVKKLLELSDSLEKSYYDKFKGKKLDVLIEEVSESGSKGHTSNYLMVHTNKKLQKGEIYNLIV